jgi:hypothetical protein
MTTRQNQVQQLVNMYGSVMNASYANNLLDDLNDQPNPLKAAINYINSTQNLQQTSQYFGTSGYGQLQPNQNYPQPNQFIQPQCQQIQPQQPQFEQLQLQQLQLQQIQLQQTQPPQPQLQQPEPQQPILDFQPSLY